MKSGSRQLCHSYCRALFLTSPTDEFGFIRHKHPASVRVIPIIRRSLPAGVYANVKAWINFPYSATDTLIQLFLSPGFRCSFYSPRRHHSMKVVEPEVHCAKDDVRLIPPAPARPAIQYRLFPPIRERRVNFFRCTERFVLSPQWGPVSVFDARRSRQVLGRGRR